MGATEQCGPWGRAGKSRRTVGMAACTCRLTPLGILVTRWFLAGPRPGGPICAAMRCAVQARIDSGQEVIVGVNKCAQRPCAATTPYVLGSVLCMRTQVPADRGRAHRDAEDRQHQSPRRAARAAGSHPHHPRSGEPRPRCARPTTRPRVAAPKLAGRGPGGCVGPPATIAREQRDAAGRPLRMSEQCQASAG